MGDRRQKRAWLRLVGAVDDGGPSGSTPQILTPSLVDSTLGCIQDDDIWVSLACIDAIENNAEVTLDLDLIRHFITLGLQRTNVGRTFDLKSEHVRYKLAIRRVLVRYKRMTSVWEQVYSVDTEQKVPTSSAANGGCSEADRDDDGDFDAWEEIAEAEVKSPSTKIPLLQFIRQSPLDHAMQLASSSQRQTLVTFVQALPPSLLRSLFPHRLAITKALLLSSSAGKVDLGHLLPLKLLPNVSNGRESDLWIDSIESSQDRQDDDIVDSKEVSDVLSSRPFGQVDEASDKPSSPEIIANDLSEASLLNFYSSCIDAFERESLASEASIQLANIVLSDGFGLVADDRFAQLAEDLRLLHPLIHSRSSSRVCSSWSVGRFREELNARPDISQRQLMATLYLEEARSDSDAIEAAREGAVPFLRSVANQYPAHADHTVDEMISEGFVHALLALADKDRLGIVTSLLKDGKQCGVDISTVQRARTALACLLGVSQDSATTQQLMDHLAASTLSGLQSVTLTGQERPLRECLGAALSRGDGRKISALQQYRFSTRLELPALRHYIERCRLHIASCQRFTEWNSALTVSLLFSAEGREEEQVSNVTRIVRSFARDHKSQTQWTSLTRELMDSTGISGSFDVLNEKMIVRLACESALRTGDVRVCWYLLREHSGHLPDTEKEELILNASRELYDNSTTSNVHQGDMKTAHDILTQSGHLKSARIEQEKAFIEATSRLCSFRIQSMLRPGIPLAPIEIRLSTDRIDLIKRLLETNQDAYKSPEMILELAQKLCAVSGGPGAGEVPSRSLTESRTLALLTEAALGQADYAAAQLSCERLVANVSKLEKRVEQSAVSQAQQHDQLREILAQTREIAYRSCFLLCNQHEWKDFGSRLTWCSHVLAYCPSDQIERYLKTWRQLEECFRQDLIDNPPKDWDHVGMQFKSSAGNGGLVATSLASIGGGLGAFESLSPFGTLFAGTRNTDSRSPSRGSHEGETKAQVKADLPPNQAAGSPSSRAARLFDSLGGNPGNASGDGTYLDPAERAARAARRFFGGFGA